MRWRSLVATLLLSSLAAACAGGPSRTTTPGPAPAFPSIATHTAGMAPLDGFVPMYWDSVAGKLWLELPAPGQDFLYMSALVTGLGSNDIGLDRSQVGDARVVHVERAGPRVLLVQANQEYRAVSDNPDERRAVEESFARSVLWGFPVAAESAGRVLVDGTDFLLRDVHDVSGTLKRARQGEYRLDASRSAFYLPRTKGFPLNSEVEVTLTFTGNQPGRWVRDVAPDPEALTVRERHSFIALPDTGYMTRRSLPGAGYFAISYADYAAPLGAPMQQRFIARHRLQKQDPTAPMSDPVKPIIYYLDRGVPEPMRSALLDGARWWNEAFTALGYRNAFRVELLPEGADPMDVRYNVIQWVHRATRGWSYGSSVIDPRTGEILKGHVLLGSLRVRQDYLLAEGLLSPYETGSETSVEARQLALARLRQLAAHEVGHTLGLAHNYVASTEGRASVMDYPQPLVTLAPDGSIDVSNAYATGLGGWDSVAIAYGYDDFPPGTDRDSALSALLATARDRGLTFLTDQDARPTGSVHPRAHLWDNGTDPVAELRRVMAVRQRALARLGERSLRAGTPLAELEEVLVPVYLYHRYQVEAAAKVVGGEYYTYAARGDGQVPVLAVPRGQQEGAVEALLETLDPVALALPDTLLRLIPPRPYTYPLHRELFDRWSGLAFDPLAPAVSAADLTVGLLLDPVRAARLVEQHALDADLPGLAEVTDQLVTATFDRAVRGSYESAIARGVERVVVDHLLDLAGTAAMPDVRAVARWQLERLSARLATGRGDTSPEARAHRALLAADIIAFLDRPWPRTDEPTAPELPPGSPIGAAER